MMFFRMLVVPLAILVPFEAFAGTATQTDWCGGDGFYGPVTDWGNEFFAGTDIECYNTPSSITLLRTTEVTPTKHTVDADFNGASSVCSADLNGDGYMDVIGAACFAHDVAWWENVDGSGTSWTKRTIDENFNGAYSVYSADINGDGYMDVLGASEDYDDITWWENVNGSGTSWTEHTIDGEFDAARSVYAADVNGDGFMDVLGAAAAANDITWWENVDGTGTSWTEHAVDGDFMGAQSVFSADVNGDGYMDVLGAAYGDNDITWWENVDGTGTSWTEHTVDADYNGAVFVNSADVNGDGYMDVLGAATFGSDDITWWENVDGTGTSWTEHTVDGAFTGAQSVTSADLNFDGYMDVLGAAQSDNDITWWENVDGTGTSWTEHTVDWVFDGAFSVLSADVNGDGYPDVLGAAYTADDIAWWNLSEYVPDGSLESSVLDIQENPHWQVLFWNCAEPTGTSVALQVRASNDFSSMGAWSDTLTAPCSLEGLLADGDEYFQYRVILSTNDVYLTPELHDVLVVWQPFTGMHGESEVETSVALYGASPNPVVGTAVLGFSLPVDSRVELTVFDLTGRTVHAISEEFCSGVHEVPVNDLASGVYMVRLTSGEFTETRHFVVIK